MEPSGPLTAEEVATIDQQKLTDWRVQEATQLYCNSRFGDVSSQLGPLHPTDNVPSEAEKINVTEQSSYIHQPTGVHIVNPEDPYNAIDGADYENYDSEEGYDDDYDDDDNDDVFEQTQSIGSHRTLSSMYQPPYSLMFNGLFEKVKMAASLENKWLIVNLQSNNEFSSQLLNRDTWSNDTLQEIIKSNFIFWQVYDDTDEGKKFRTYYKLESLPAVLIIEPITGKRMKAWNGVIQPDFLLEALSAYFDKGPDEHLFGPSQNNLAETVKVSNSVDDMETEDMEDAKTKLEYLPLRDEPEFNKELHCRIVVRLPDRQRLQRTFLRSEPIKLLWPWCSLKLEESDTKRPFQFRVQIPGCESKCLEYKDDLTFEKLGVSNSVVNLVFPSTT